MLSTPFIPLLRSTLIPHLFCLVYFTVRVVFSFFLSFTSTNGYNGLSSMHSSTPTGLPKQTKARPSLGPPVPPPSLDFTQARLVLGHATTSPIYQCQQCDASFKTNAFLDAHRRRDHQSWVTHTLSDRECVHSHSHSHFVSHSILFYSIHSFILVEPFSTFRICRENSGSFQCPVKTCNAMLKEPGSMRKHLKKHFECEFLFSILYIL